MIMVIVSITMNVSMAYTCATQTRHVLTSMADTHASATTVSLVAGLNVSQLISARLVNISAHLMPTAFQAMEHMNVSA